jgi:hypothetical protein
VGEVVLIGVAFGVEVGLSASLGSSVGVLVPRGTGAAVRRRRTGAEVLISAGDLVEGTGSGPFGLNVGVTTIDGWDIGAGTGEPGWTGDFVGDAEVLKGLELGATVCGVGALLLKEIGDTVGVPSLLGL